MPNILIIQGDKKLRAEARAGMNLLQLIQSNGFSIVAPCGGNGTCGKCRVQIKGGESVSSCIYYPEKDMELILPDHRESQILTTQYEYSLPVPLNPGDSIKLVSYPLGVAIDIGTTTVVFYLLNLITGSIINTKGIQNPQAKYGADVISRIQHCSEAGGLKQLQKEIIDIVNQELIAFASLSGVDNNAIVKITITGNTTMLHLFLGVDPTSIAQAPFTPVFLEEQTLINKDFGLMANKDAEINLLPSISAYVGADIVSGLASLDPPEQIKNYLFIDIGTNGEIALVTPEKTFCCATAAGPAFEGANISCGMGAFAGAIASYNGPDLYTTIAREAAIGICGSGLIDIVSYLLRQKLVTKDGILENDYRVYGVEDKKDSIYITQQDIREVQLAKAAIMAGIHILVKTANLEYEQIDALFLAGGFGNYINIESAIQIALLPSQMSDKIIAIGNTSGSGACLALKSKSFMNNISELLQKAKYIELSTHEDFVLEYALKMSFSENPSDL